MEFFSNLQCSGHVKLKQHNTIFACFPVRQRHSCGQNFVHGGDSFTRTWMSSIQRTRLIQMWRISVFCLASSRLKTSRNGEISKPSTGNASPISGLTGNMKNRQTTLFSVTCCQGTVQCHSEIEPGQDDTPKFLAELSTLKV